MADVGEGLPDRGELHRDLGVPAQTVRGERLEEVDVRRHGGIGLLHVEGVLAEEVEGRLETVVDQPPR